MGKRKVEIPANDKDFWDQANVLIPKQKTPISLRLDSDIIEFFKKDGEGYQSKINAVLKSYIAAYKKKK
jgi:uncharacterized protein (DUF4415 family)